ncbi:hypothetical protein CEXT_448431 [Caerostris extrusa]|uniref:Uncharacterized protein n=1 Tax=Caerostris extrusa TaxID=172846 RepID=A0AAV4MEM4_CAEEX|nr:hypothetical protein CEXT_448431 [Caerostris extrusa]
MFSIHMLLKILETLLIETGYNRSSLLSSMCPLKCQGSLGFIFSVSLIVAHFHFTCQVVHFSKVKNFRRDTYFLCKPSVSGKKEYTSNSRLKVNRVTQELQLAFFVSFRLLNE